MHKPIPTLFMEEMKKQVQNFIVVYRPDERQEIGGCGLSDQWEGLMNVVVFLFVTQQ